MKLKRFVILIIALLVISLVWATAAGSQTSTRSSLNGCASCHSGSRVLWVNITTYTIPGTINISGSDTISVTLEITGDGGGSKWQCDLSVSVASTNGYIGFSNNPQIVDNRRPYYSNTFTFPITGNTGGQDTITITAQVDPDHKHSIVSDSVNGPIDIITPNTAPLLSLDQISSTSGSTTDTFSYTVVYTDANDDAPSGTLVHIDGDNSGLTMTQDSSASLSLKDGDYTNGEQYIYQTSLESGTHNYYFSASDGLLDASTNLKNGPSVSSPSNNLPELLDHIVSPLTGLSDQVFRFAATYTDADDESPSFIKVLLDDESTGVTMALDTNATSNLHDGDYTNGERYFYEMTLSLGDHSYKYDFSDGTDSLTTIVQSGPVVFSNLSPEAIITLPGNNSKFFKDEEITFDATDSLDPLGGGLDFMWVSDTAGTLSTLSLFTTSLEVGTHRITIEVSDQDQKRDSTWINIEVLELPIVPLSISSWQPFEKDVSIYESRFMDFNVTVAGDGVLSYNWSLDGVGFGVNSERFTYYADPPSIGFHELDVSIVNDLEPPQNVTYTWTIQVLDPAPFIVWFDPKTDQSIEEGSNLDLSIEAKDPQDLPLNYTWLLDGEIVSEGETFIFDAKETRTYLVIAMIENPEGYYVKHDWNVEVMPKTTMTDDGRITRGSDVSLLSDDMPTDIAKSTETVIDLRDARERDLDGSILFAILISVLFLLICVINLAYVGFKIKKRKDNKTTSEGSQAKIEPTDAQSQVEQPAEVEPFPEVPELGGSQHPVSQEYFEPVDDQGYPPTPIATGPYEAPGQIQPPIAAEYSQSVMQQGYVQQPTAQPELAQEYIQQPMASEYPGVPQLPYQPPVASEYPGVPQTPYQPPMASEYPGVPQAPYQSSMASEYPGVPQAPYQSSMASEYPSVPQAPYQSPVASQYPGVPQVPSQPPMASQYHVESQVPYQPPIAQEYLGRMG